MTSIIASAAVAILIALIVVFDIRYILKKKKEGKCIGCPQAGSCNRHCG